MHERERKQFGEQAQRKVGEEDEVSGDLSSLAPSVLASNHESTHPQRPARAPQQAQDEMASTRISGPDHQCRCGKIIQMARSTNKKKVRLLKNQQKRQTGGLPKGLPRCGFPRYCWRSLFAGSIHTQLEGSPAVAVIALPLSGMGGLGCRCFPGSGQERVSEPDNA